MDDIYTNEEKKKRTQERKKLNKKENWKKYYKI